MACGCQKTEQFKVLNADGDEVYSGAKVAAQAVFKRYPGGTLLDAAGNVVEGGEAPAPEPAPTGGA